MSRFSDIMAIMDISEELSKVVFFTHDEGDYHKKLAFGIDSEDSSDDILSGKYVSFTIMNLGESDGPALRGNKDTTDPFRLALQSTQLSKMEQFGEIRFFTCNPLLWSAPGAKSPAGKDLGNPKSNHKYIADPVFRNTVSRFGGKFPLELTKTQFIDTLPISNLSYITNKPRLVDLRPEIRLIPKGGMLDVSQFIQKAKASLYVGKSDGSFELVEHGSDIEHNTIGVVAKIKATITDSSLALLDRLREEFGDDVMMAPAPQTAKPDVANYDIPISSNKILTVRVSFHEFNPKVRIDLNNEPYKDYSRLRPLSRAPFYFTSDRNVDANDPKRIALISKFTEDLIKLVGTIISDLQ